MGTKTFVPDMVNEAKALGAYIQKHGTDIFSTTTGLTSPQMTAVTNLKTACDAVVAQIPVHAQEP